MSISNDGGYERGIAVTPDNNTDLVQVPRALSAVAAGAIAVTLEGDTASVILSIAAGVPLRVRAKRVLSTGTTATGIVALY